MAFDIRTLHEIERKIIKALANGKLTLDVLTQQTGLNVDQVRRGIEWLRSKNIITVNEKITKFLSVGSEGVKAVQNGLPERRLVNSLRPVGTVAISDAKKLSALSDVEFNVAFSNARAKGWIKPSNDKSSITISEIGRAHV